MERAIAEMTLFKRAAGSSPYAGFGKTIPFSIGGCERNCVNFDKRRYSSSSCVFSPLIYFRIMAADFAAAAFLKVG